MCKIQRDPLDPQSLQDLENIFVNLGLSKGNTETAPVDYRYIHKVGTGGQFAKRILVEGEAGAGKTTLCAKIAWDWIKGNAFQEFQLVLIVPLRESETKTIGDVVKTYLSASNPVSSRQLDAYILSNPDKVFIVLDGLDEMGASLSELSQIMEILLLRRFHTGTVLVTSRPWKAALVYQIPGLASAYKFLTIEGFSQTDVAAYIEKFFQPRGTASGEDLLRFVQDNDVIANTVPMYAMYLSMLCTAWKELGIEMKKTMRKLQTFSGLLREIINFLTDHYIAKNDVGSGEGVQQHRQYIGSILEKIGQVALNGLVSKQPTFSADDFSDLQTLEIGCKVGILSQKTTQPTPEKLTMDFQVLFSHKLFQEYTAGLYLRSLMKSNLAEFDNLMISVISLRLFEFRYVLYFASSHGEDIAMSLMDYVLQESMEEDFLVDFAFESHNPALARVVSERILKNKIDLEISLLMSPHTVSGYLFIMEHCQFPLVRVCALFEYSVRVLHCIWRTGHLDQLGMDARVNFGTI